MKERDRRRREETIRTSNHTREEAAEEREIWEIPKRQNKHKPKHIFNNIQRNKESDSRRGES